MKLRHLTSEIVKDKIIVVREDFNVPIKDGKVSETTRIEESLPTLQFLLQNNVQRIHLLTHIGRPKNGYDPFLSTKNLVPILEQFLGKKVEFRPDFTSGTEQIQIHENTRFWPEEKKGDSVFIKGIYQNLKPDLFINDGFAVSHRAEASVVGLAKYVPAYPGFLVEKEIKALSPFLTLTKIPGLTTIISGVKMETKIPVLEHFVKISENVLLGGCIANTFLAAEGNNIGESILEPEFFETAKNISKIAKENNIGLHLPVDAICAEEIESQDVEALPIDDIQGKLKIFDIGLLTIKSYSEILQHSKIVIWNGPLGVLEQENFSNGTKAILMILKSLKSAQTIIGGGDTIKALKKWNVSKSEFTHVSTGGGAMLEFLEGKDLPGIKILEA